LLDSGRFLWSLACGIARSTVVKGEFKPVTVHHKPMDPPKAGIPHDRSGASCRNSAGARRAGIIDFVLPDFAVLRKLRLKLFSTNGISRVQCHRQATLAVRRQTATLTRCPAPPGAGW
jgi:hypothetical protein